MYLLGKFQPQCAYALMFSLDLLHKNILIKYQVSQLEAQSGSRALAFYNKMCLRILCSCLDNFYHTGTCGVVKALSIEAQSGS